MRQGIFRHKDNLLVKLNLSQQANLQISVSHWEIVSQQVELRIKDI